uniref:Uncharacterized protein n=1 Tax=Romanomermis culicivorax TaxID=13658 RepID=A0A915KI66_ROMCU
MAVPKGQRHFKELRVPCKGLIHNPPSARGALPLRELIVLEPCSLMQFTAPVPWLYATVPE